MAIIKDIHIRNYKAFLADQRIEIHPVTVLIGKNSSGKSPILKLLPLFANATSSLTAYLIHSVYLKCIGIQTSANPLLRTK